MKRILDRLDRWLFDIGFRWGYWVAGRQIARKARKR